jgi:hypothetical protein
MLTRATRPAAIEAEPNASGGAGWTPYLLALLLCAAALGNAVLQDRPPRPAPVDAPPRAFSAGRAQEVLRELMGDGSPHPIGSAANRAVRERIILHLVARGYQPEIQRRFVCSAFRRYCGEVENVLARLEGSDASGAVLLNSHYDTQPATPGASDPMAGVAALLEIARAMRDAPPPRQSVIFLFNDGEEAGLLGATAFVEHHPWARDVRAVVNLDARGSRGPSLLASTIGDDRRLVRHYAARAPHPAGSSLLPTLISLLPNQNDLTVFERLGVPGALVGYLGGFRNYHSATDTLANTDPGSLQQHGETALAVVSGLADDDLSDPETGRVVFFPLAGTVAWWPEGWSILLASLALVLVVTAIARRSRRGDVGAGELLWGLLGAVLGIAAGGAGGLVADKVRQAIVAIPSDWVADPVPSVLAVWCGAIAGSSAVGALLRRRAGVWGAWGAVSLVWAGSAIALALLLPGASFLAVFPALAAGLLGQLRRGVTALALAVVAVWVWLPPLWFLHELAGLAAPTVAALVVGSLWIGLAPLLPVRRMRYAVPVAAAALAGVLLVIAARMPTFTAEQPQFLSLVHVSDADERKGWWLATGYPLPEALSAAGGFANEADDASDPLPWSRIEQGSVATAPWVELHGPQLREIETAPEEGGRRVRATLASSRRAPLVQIVLRDPSRLASARVAGEELPPDQTPYPLYRDGFDAITIWTLPAEGIVVELSVKGDEPLELILVDRSYDLPKQAAPLIAARPPTAAPNQNGDSTIVIHRQVV